MTEPRADLKPGYYVLNTDGGMASGHGRRRSGDPLGQWGRSVRSYERPVWAPWLRSRGRSGLPPTTRRNTER